MNRSLQTAVMVAVVIALVPFAANQVIDLTYAVGRKPPTPAAMLNTALWLSLAALAVAVAALLAALWKYVSSFFRTLRGSRLADTVGAVLAKASSQEKKCDLQPLIDGGLVFGPKTEYLSYSCAVRRDLTELRDDITSYVRGTQADDGRKSKPFTVLIWGPPGSGKSFLVEELARAASVDACAPTVLEANLALMRSEDGLVEHLEDCRKQAEEGKVPFVLFDEVDSRLPADATFQRLLVPTWDGKFHDGSRLRELGPCVLFFGCSFGLGLAACVRARYHWYRGKPEEVRAARVAGIRSFFEGKPKGPDFLDRMLRVICLTEVNETESRGREHRDGPAKMLIAMTAVQIRKQFGVTDVKADVLAALALLPGTTAREITKRVRRCRRPSGEQDGEAVFSMNWLPADLRRRCKEIVARDSLQDIKGKCVVIANEDGKQNSALGVCGL